MIIGLYMVAYALFGAFFIGLRIKEITTAFSKYDDDNEKGCMFIVAILLWPILLMLVLGEAVSRWRTRRRGQS